MFCLFGAHKNPKLHSFSLLFDHATITCRIQGKGHWHAGSWNGGSCCCQTSKCARVTISCLRSRYQETNSTRDRARTGRPRVTTPAQDNHIRLRYLRNRQLTAASSARETPGTHSPRIREHTVRQRLRKAGLRRRRPYFGMVLTDDRRRRRLQWGRNYRDQPRLSVVSCRDHNYNSKLFQEGTIWDYV